MSAEHSSWLVRVLLLLATMFALSPFWLTLRPPMQDLPQHLAAGRVLLDGSNPDLNFASYFTVEWLRSQYLGIYLLMGAFFHPASWFTDEPLLWANRLAIVVLGGSWVIGTELLYRRVTHRDGLGAFSLALFFNVHLILGFLNFLLGISTAFLCLALFSSLRSQAATWRVSDWRVWTLALLLTACFYFHIVPFGVACAVMVSCGCLDAGVVLVGRKRQRDSTALPRAHWTTYLALVPALLAMSSWLGTPSGMSTREAAAGGGSRGKAHYLDMQANHDALPSWTMDAFRTEWDTRWLTIALVGLGVYGLIQWFWSAWLRWSKPTSPEPGNTTSNDTLNTDFVADPVLLWLLRGVAPACFVAYYVLPASYDWIWPINARFPILALLFLPFWLPANLKQQIRQIRLRWALRATDVTAFALLSGVGIAQTSLARSAFAGFATEMEGFDEILEQIPPGKRVATLVFDRGSRHIGFAPFLHIGAFYQAERGGVSFFSFNDFPQSPVRFREDNRPPRVEPRWEWKPERVRPERDLVWFDYVLVRGGPPHLKHADGLRVVAAQGRFRLFQKTP